MHFIDLKKQYQLIESDINKSIQAVLNHGQYIMGPEVAELEDALASYTGAKHAISCSSGTDALLMALMAMDIQPGDEVITSPFTFFATGEVIALCQAVPVFVDIDPRTYNLDPNYLEAAITPKTKAIMPVSLYGQCADMDEINLIADKYSIAVIEDAAQSFGATYKGRQSCALSTIGCTSFFPSKPLGAYGDAGACFTNSDAIADRLKQIRIHGQGQRYQHHIIGLNARMDTIQAAILKEKLKLFPSEVQLREKIGERYNELLKSSVKTPYICSGNTSVYAQYTIEVPNRAAIQQRMNEQGIPTAVHYPIAMHMQTALSQYGFKKGDFPISERASERVMSLPMHPYLSQSEQNTIVDALKVCLDQLAEVEV